MIAIVYSGYWTHITIRIPQRTLEEQDDVEAGEAVVEAAHREQKQPFRKVGREDGDAGCNVVVT